MRYWVCGMRKRVSGKRAEEAVLGIGYAGVDEVDGGGRGNRWRQLPPVAVAIARLTDYAPRITHHASRITLHSPPYST